MDRQPELIQPEHLSPRLRWEKLFSFLPPWPELPSQYGRKPYERSALLKALLYQRLTRRRFLQDLHRHLLENPALLAALGFDPYQPPPSLERFSAFLTDTPHSVLQSLRTQLVQALLGSGVISGHHLGLDSCPIASWVRENNLKAWVPGRRFDNTSPPKADPDARVGVRIHSRDAGGQSQVRYFWGYRNHILADLEAELPLWEITEPNSVAEVTVAIPLLSTGLSTLGLHPQSICGDAEYDVEALLRFILQDLKAKAFIPYNPRNQNKSGFRREAQRVFCPANLPMHRHGRMTVKGITYLQYRCPLYFGSRQQVLLCPANHPKFSHQKGCNYLWRLTDTPRDQIPYGTQLFTEHYNRRTAVERIFSRLLSITMEEPSVRGLASVRNHCTVAHIAVLLVAWAAHRLGHQDKIRFICSFVPDFLNTSPAPPDPEK